MKHNLIAFSIFSLAICFVIGSWLISNSLDDNKTKQVKEDQHQLLTKTEVANYLGISIQELTEKSIGDGSYTSEIPHIKIQKTYYYPKKQ